MHPPAILTASTAPKGELSGFRGQLEQQRQFRIEQLKELATQLSDAATAPQLHVTLALKTAAEHALHDIDDALRRLDDGTYGTCSSCRESIRLERLEVIPASRYCLRCQYWTESAGVTPSGMHAASLA